MWSYSFTNYGNFGSLSNAVVPRPMWPMVGPNVNVPVSTTPPLNETDFNAMDFLLWKQFGKEILIKSNINNWITCSPGKGSLVDWQIGNINCKITKHLSDNCLQVSAPSYLRIVRTPAELIFDCGPVFLGSPSVYYYFDGCTKKDWPTHDPCAQNNKQALQHVINPHGNIFLR